ncbi:MAG: hypothetical protein IJ572_04350 [Bacilli bacterium]|nr:hypothetical protein [Bacilli bacterium]
MSIFNKIKNVLFTEEDETEEIPMIRKEVATPKIEESVEEETRFKSFNYEEDNVPLKEEVKIVTPREEVKIEEPKVEQPKVEEKSPFQSFDEEEFDRIAAINKTRLMERDRRAREEKEKKSSLYNEVREVKYSEPKEEEGHRFKPSPVISPVYGILDKNYTKDDILPRASSEGTLPKIMDVDEVRQKAFGTLEDIEKNIKEESLDNIKITSFENSFDDNDMASQIEEKVEKEIEENVSKKDMFEEELEASEEQELPKIEAEEEPIKLDDYSDTASEAINEVKKEDEQIENDLFDLIDSMYQEEGGK